jgi:hypothetical protein
MSIQTVINFKNSSSAVEDIPSPETGEVAGRAFIIIDNDNDTVYRFIMPVEIAKQQGQRLMGIGNVEIANGAGMQQEIAKRDGHKS